MSVGEKINEALQQAQFTELRNRELIKQIDFTKKMEDQGILKKQQYNASPLDLTGDLQSENLTTFLVT